MFGMEEYSVVDMPQYALVEFVGRALYGIFTIVMVIVLLNMLIAMITNSFQKIEVRAAGSPAGVRLHPGSPPWSRMTPWMMRTWSGSSPAPNSTCPTSGRA
ncbi:hypothetical protein KIL84_019930 [Mauremys mutica]|uniref:Ion transport domain-containing protein n=1 Tax=Mauremys mutica TaxID=74926 RepID=A0A9D3XVS1_9SAUR|nr:hypothetical protein KIL84_019930 [Mauremys mutica]